VAVFSIDEPAATPVADATVGQTIPATTIRGARSRNRMARLFFTGSYVPEIG
jgi:hypothetical protein